MSDQTDLVALAQAFKEATEGLAAAREAHDKAETKVACAKAEVGRREERLLVNMRHNQSVIVGDIVFTKAVFDFRTVLLISTLGHPK